MPRYFVDTYNSTNIQDDIGVDLPDLATLRREIHTTLSAMMEEEKNGRHHIQLRADARDEDGARVMTATLLLVVDDH